MHTETFIASRLEANHFNIEQLTNLVFNTKQNDYNNLSQDTWCIFTDILNINVYMA